MTHDIRISQEELEKVYRENSNIKAAKILKMSPTTLMKLILERGIVPKGRGNPVGRRRKFKVV